MKLNSLSPAPGSTTPRKRVGRGIGSGLGKTSGKGHKGQKARAGVSISPSFEGGQMPLHMRLPKFGFISRVGLKTAEVRTSELNQVNADVIDVAALRKANVITSNITRVKVMLSGEVTRPVTLKGVRVTKGARAAIEAAGGKVEDVPPTQAEIEAANAKKKPAAGKRRKKASAESGDE